mmetsp:Transcript_16670/g.33863  ORF Transcript_16670/g.33863 Transcript_16670/m.33863 type:complete len:294 (-) Transcript_16670:604-1485(-)
MHDVIPNAKAHDEEAPDEHGEGQSHSMVTRISPARAYEGSGREDIHDCDRHRCSNPSESNLQVRGDSGDQKGEADDAKRYGEVPPGGPTGLTAEQHGHDGMPQAEICTRVAQEHRDKHRQLQTPREAVRRERCQQGVLVHHLVGEGDVAPDPTTHKQYEGHAQALDSNPVHLVWIAAPEARIDGHHAALAREAIKHRGDALHGLHEVATEDPDVRQRAGLPRVDEVENCSRHGRGHHDEEDRDRRVANGDQCAYLAHHAKGEDDEDNGGADHADHERMLTHSKNSGFGPVVRL